MTDEDLHRTIAEFVACYTGCLDVEAVEAADAIIQIPAIVAGQLLRRELVREYGTKE